MKKNPENYDADNVFIDTISRIYNACLLYTSRCV